MSTPSPLPRYIKKIQQHPQELVEFTDFIRKANVKSYLEIGCKFGGMLWSVAHAMPNKGRVVAVDLPFGAWGRSDSEEPLRECVAELKGEGFDAHLFIGDSTATHVVQAVQKLGPFDCVFIDANHTEKYVRADFGNYAHLGKHCCFHDIGWNNPTPVGRLPIEVPKVWATLKIDLAERATFREIKHDHGHNGIGIDYMAVDITIVTWMWGKKYSSHYISRLQRGVRQHLRQPHRFVTLTPYPTDEALFKGCFVRLRMFSPAFQKHYCLAPGMRVVCLDLDLIVTGELDPLFDRDESLVVLQGANAANPCPFNCSVMMFTAGTHAELWESFSLEKAATIPFYQFPDDQGWIHHLAPAAAGWQVGSPSGIYAFRKPGWPKDDQLPADARIVAFPGARDPSQFQHLPWVRECWQ